MIICEENMQRYTLLTQIVDALNFLRLGLGLRNSHQQKRGENCDDGNDNQQFSQRERKIFFIRVQSVFHPWLKLF